MPDTRRVILPRVADEDMMLAGMASDDLMANAPQGDAVVAAYAAMRDASPHSGCVSEEEVRRAVQAHVARRCMVLDHPDVLLGMSEDELREERESMRTALSSLGLEVG